MSLSGALGEVSCPRPGDSASDPEAAIELRRLLVDLCGTSAVPVRIIAEEYGVSDTYGGWTKSLPVEFFPWRKVRDEKSTTYFWASDLVDHGRLDPLLLSAAEERGYLVITDDDVSWAFCPYFAGVDILFPSSRGRDQFVSAHLSMAPRHPSGL